MRLADLVRTSESVAATSSRLDKVAQLAALLKQVHEDELPAAVAFLSGATTQGRLGIGWTAIAAAADVIPVEQPSLAIGDVDRAFGAVASMTGQGSARDRSQALRALFARATAPEQDFLKRLVFGELRQGALEAVLIDALARAADVPAARLRRAAMMAGDLGPVAQAAFRGGAGALDAFVVQVMRPVRPMLAATGDTVEDALASLGDAALELKLDGARVQAHKEGDLVRVFSRELNDVTARVPEIVAAVSALPVRDAILDGEALALAEGGRPHPFQTTMRRFGRTRGVDQMQASLPLTPFMFDVLYADGAVLVDEPLERRLRVLRDIAPAMAVPQIVRPTPAEAAAFARDARDRGHEGVMAKALDAPYAAGRRGAAWLKVKQARTLDLVVLAAEWGHGRRRGWLSNLHLGARDPAHNNFVMLGKTFKGLTDATLAWQTAQLIAREIGRDAYTVYVRPELVVEIAFNEVQRSPVYPGGLALRFARVVRYRSDKSAADADTIDAVRALASTRSADCPSIRDA